MGSSTPAPELRLEIRRTFAAPREKVFRAWTEREGLERWMCRDVPTHDPQFLELDVRPGGRYAIEIKMPDGVVYLGQGTYREVKPPERLVFTWAWMRTPESKTENLQTSESLVTVEFFDRGGSTEMVFTHWKLTGQESRDVHRKGWMGCFDVLAEYLKN